MATDFQGVRSLMEKRESDWEKREIEKKEKERKNSDSVVGQINESTVSSFTGKGVVFMSPKQVIMEECLVQNVQQVERTDLVGRSLGVVVRNATGIVVFATVVPLKFYADVQVVEAKAILAGIQLAAERGLLPLLVETDSLNVSRFPPRRRKERDDGDGELTDPELTQSPLTSEGKGRTKEDNEAEDEDLSSRRRKGCPKG
ncbi:hypothetical protein ACOSQ4_021300 [Xanthoceras sorbifolium]